MKVNWDPSPVKLGPGEACALGDTEASQLCSVTWSALKTYIQAALYKQQVNFRSIYVYTYMYTHAKTIKRLRIWKRVGRGTWKGFSQHSLWTYWPQALSMLSKLSTIFPGPIWRIIIIKKMSLKARVILPRLAHSKNFGTWNCTWKHWVICQWILNSVTVLRTQTRARGKVDVQAGAFYVNLLYEFLFMWVIMVGVIIFWVVYYSKNRLPGFSFTKFENHLFHSSLYSPWGSCQEWYLGLNPLTPTYYGQIANNTGNTLFQMDPFIFYFSSPSVLNWNHSQSSSYHAASAGSSVRRKIPLFVLILTTVHAIESVGKASQKVAFYYFSLLPRAPHLTHVLTGPHDSAQWSCSPSLLILPPPYVFLEALLSAWGFSFACIYSCFLFSLP